MFRLSLLSLLVISVSAIEVDILRKLQGLEPVRKLQGLEDFQALEFNFAGITFSMGVAEAECPNEFDPVIQCIITDCPTIIETCPDLTANIPAEYVGAGKFLTLTFVAGIARKENKCSLIYFAFIVVGIYHN
jgi:hypothetical protein